MLSELKPDVKVTHDAGCDYGHPDHIATHNATVKAFYAASDPAQYPAAGEIFRHSKLYVEVRPRKIMRLMIKLMPLFGQNPHHFGRNKDIDLTKTTSVEYPAHAVIRPTKQAIEIRVRATACHASQGGGQRHRGQLLFWINVMLSRQ